MSATGEDGFLGCCLVIEDGCGWCEVEVGVAVNLVPRLTWEMAERRRCL